jgi:hypothetical protein
MTTNTTLTWVDLRFAAVVRADSARPVEAPYTGSHYLIEEDDGFRPGSPNTAPAFLLRYISTDDEGDEAQDIDLGHHYPHLDAAKAAAERYEQTGDPFGGAQDLRLRNFNLTAEFAPQVLSRPGGGPTTNRPCIVVAGVQVYAYFDETTGQLVISAHYDSADETVLDDSGSVPTRVKLGPEIVFEEAARELTAPVALTRESDRLHTSTPIAASSTDASHNPHHFADESALAYWLRLQEGAVVRVWDLDRSTGRWVERSDG